MGYTPSNAIALVIAQQSAKPFGKGAVIYMGPGNGSSICLGGGNYTNVGTTAVQPPVEGAGFDVNSSRPRLTHTSSASANQVAGFRSPTAQVMRGSTATKGGFRFTCTFSTQSSVTNQRAFVGLNGSTGAITGAFVPSNQTDCILFAYDDGQTTWRIMHNDGSGTCTAVDLGANFPVTPDEIYTVQFTALPGGSVVTYRVERLSTGDVAEGTLSSNLPATTTALTTHALIGNGAGGGAATLCHYGTGIESPPPAL